MLCSDKMLGGTGEELASDGNSGSKIQCEKCEGIFKERFIFTFVYNKKNFIGQVERSLKRKIEPKFRAP